MMFLCDAGKIVAVQAKDARDAALLTLLELGPQARMPITVYHDDMGEAAGYFIELEERGAS